MEIKLSPELQEAFIVRALKWIETHNYKLPKPSTKEVKEIYVFAHLVPTSHVIDVLVFDSRSCKLKAIELDYYKTQANPISRINLPYRASNTSKFANKKA